MSPAPAGAVCAQPGSLLAFEADGACAWLSLWRGAGLRNAEVAKYATGTLRHLASYGPNRDDMLADTQLVTALLELLARSWIRRIRADPEQAAIRIQTIYRARRAADGAVQLRAG